MTTTAKTWTLAVMDTHGAWDHCGDFTTREEAVEKATHLHAAGHVHAADDGGSTWGLSDDPDSGHYEERFGIWTEDGKSVVVDPLP